MNTSLGRAPLQEVPNDLRGGGRGASLEHLRAAGVLCSASVAFAEGDGQPPYAGHVNSGIGNGGEVSDDGGIVAIAGRGSEVIENDLDPGRSGAHNKINTWEQDFKPLTVGRGS